MLHSVEPTRPALRKIAATRLALPVVAALAALTGISSAQAAPQEPTSMRFEWVKEGPAETCGENCREWISAAGPIGLQTAQDFEMFARAKDVRGATVVVESGGGVVFSGMDLGRLFRKYGVNTMVGHTTKLPADASGETRATLSPRALCASMCPFVVLGGVKRSVPVEAKIQVHQIWPGGARGDATAVTYSAEDLSRIQNDLGKLARYTVDMGASVELFEMAMRVPPWEYLRHLTKEEVRRTRLHTVDSVFNTPKSNPGPQALAPNPEMQLAWTLVDKDGKRQLSRRHPLTIEGESIGSFEIALSCGDKPDAFTIAYSERRKVANPAAARLKEVALFLGGEHLVLKVESSGQKTEGEELGTVARGTITSAFLNAYTDPKRAVTVSTATVTNVRTAIMVGNTGLRQSFSQLASMCKS